MSYLNELTGTAAHSREVAANQSHHLIAGVDRDVVLSLKDISKFFPGVKALDKVNLAVVAGEVHGLVGENGAGKSTLMGVASGSLVANEGQMSFMGHLVEGNPEHIRDLGLAIVRQEPLLLPDLTVAENIWLGLPERARPAIADMRRFAADALSAWSDDTDIAVDERIESLNPEKRFIVEIVKALASDLRLLVLDEPTEHLMAEDVQRLFARIRALTARGISVIYISHRIKEVQQIADRLTVLRDGKSVGTYAADGLSEDDIVTLIVGSTLDAEFPPKGHFEENDPVVLRVAGYCGPNFHDVDLQLKHGEIVGLAGIDANGQREFLRALAGLNAGSGAIEVAGKAVTIRNPKAAIAAGFSFLPGDRHREGMAGDLTVRENFTMRSLGRDIVGPFIRHSSETTRSQTAIRQFAVKTPSTETQIGTLSGGNQQKIILASVIAADPKVLLIDEPTQGVDVGARAEIYAKLREIASRGVAIIIVSSDANEIAGLCDRVMVFSRGTIVERIAGDAVSENAITGAVLRATSVRVRHHARISPFVKWASGNWAPMVMVGICVIMMGIVASSISPTYLSPRGLAMLMVLVTTLALVAYGQQLLMLVGGIDLSVGPLMGLVGVVGSFYLQEDAGVWMHAIGFAAILATALGVGLLNFTLIEIIKLHPLIATLATYMGLQAVSLLLRPTPDGMIDYAILDIVGYRLGFVPVAFLVMVALALVLERILFRSGFGISLRGHGSRAEAARLMGISPRSMRLIAYLGCSLLAGIAGITMMAQVGIGDARAGIGYTLTSIAAAVIGGASLFGARGSFIGAFFGALLITQVNQVASFLRLDAAWSNYLLGGIILIAVTLYSTSRKKALAA